MIATRTLTFLLVSIAVLQSAADGQTDVDRVQRRNGIDSGSITAVTPLGITISKGGVTSKIGAEEIRSIQFAGEPTEFKSARTQYERGRFDQALERLEKVDRSSLARDEIKQELDYLLAACRANLALASKADRKAALAEIGEFLSTHRASYHVPEAIELQGDLYQATGEYDLARKKYETLAKAPTPFYKARSAMLVAELLQQQNKHAEAIAEFDAAVAAAGTSALTADIRNAAILGRAVSLSATGKHLEGLDIVRKVIQRTSLDDTAKLAEGYNALGACHLAADDIHAARDAYLHVDLLFNSAEAEHAESLFHLTNIWKGLRQPTRAQDAQQRLTDQYALSRWAGR